MQISQFPVLYNLVAGEFPVNVKPKFPVPHATTQLTNISPKSLIETPEKVINYYLN